MHYFFNVKLFKLVTSNQFDVLEVNDCNILELDFLNRVVVSSCLNLFMEELSVLVT